MTFFNYFLFLTFLREFPMSTCMYLYFSMTSSFFLNWKNTHTQFTWTQRDHIVKQVSYIGIMVINFHSNDFFLLFVLVLRSNIRVVECSCVFQHNILFVFTWNRYISRIYSFMASFYRFVFLSSDDHDRCVFI